MSRHQSHIDEFTVKQEETTEVSVSEDVLEIMAKCWQFCLFPKGYCHLLSPISDMSFWIGLLFLQFVMTVENTFLFE